MGHQRVGKKLESKNGKGKQGALKIEVQFT